MIASWASVSLGIDHHQHESVEGEPSDKNWWQWNGVCVWVAGPPLWIKRIIMGTNVKATRIKDSRNYEEKLKGGKKDMKGKKINSK